MKRWPLKWKIAFYAAALGIVATIAGACTTWIVMHYWEVAAFGADTPVTNQIGRDIVFGMFAAIPTVLLVVLLGGRLVARRAVGPIDEIREAAERITPKNLDQRLPVPAAADEIAGLVRVLNSTFDRLQRSFEQSVRFSSDASHHLKTPLAVLRAGIEEILNDPKVTAEQQEQASALLHQVHQLTSIAENLLLLARADSGSLNLKHEEFDLRQVLDGVCDDARAMAEPKQLKFETNLAAQLPVVGDRPAIALIMQNLMENGIKYTQAGGSLCIEAQGRNGNVEVAIKNNGAPIPPGRAQHIFERFYRARPDARVPGSGLGLSVAAELAKAQGGDLELVRSNGDWTEFRLTLPRK